MDLDAFIAQRETFDVEVWTTRGIDHFCSSSAWILAAHHAFHHESEPIILKNAFGFAPFQRVHHPLYGHLLMPLEASWLLSSPIISRSPATFMAKMADYMRLDKLQWNTFLLSGIVESCPIILETIRSFGKHYKIYQGPNTIRRIADIREGLEGFLNNRSARFRKNMRRTVKRLADLGVHFEMHHRKMDPQECEAYYTRVLNIEKRSWKGLSGVGIDDGNMRTFYHRLMLDQGEQGIICLGFAQHNGEDIGYILGGIMHHTYRGYQFSYIEPFHPYSLGNWMQYKTIQFLDEKEKQVAFYDLGTDMEYKMTWSDIPFETTSIIISNL